MKNVTFHDTDMRIRFNKWDMDSYNLFLQTKSLPEYRLEYDYEKDEYIITSPARFADIIGVKSPVADHGWLPFAEHLWDYQEHFCKVALEAKRYAIWADTGLGKTAIYLEWARQVHHRTGKSVLIIVPLNIIGQVMEEASRFYGKVFLYDVLKTREELKTWCRTKETIGIVNHEKFIPRDGVETIDEIRYCGGVVLDESSCLKSGGGKIKWALIKSCKGVEYKLSCTATPAPNDTMEYASQASFLEKLRNEGEILWTYFTRDKQGNWKVKDHAQGAFFRFMASWSIYLRNPARFGFADHLKDLPEPEVYTKTISMTNKQSREIQNIPTGADGQLSFIMPERLGITHRTKLSQIAKGFVYEDGAARRIHSWKPIEVAETVCYELSRGRQVIVWTLFDEETDIIMEYLSDCEHTVQALTGKTKQKDRQDIIERFRKGEIDVLVTRASMLGHGLNFQNCKSMVFSGFNDSFEQFYQAVRRAYRYGQTEPVRVHIPYIPELEGVIYQNIMAKQDRFMHDTAVQEKNYIGAMI